MNDPFQMQRELRYGAPVCDEILTGRYFTIGYSWYFRQAKWTLEIVDLLEVNLLDEEARRDDNFRADVRIPREFRASLNAYKGSGYDRGHLVASANMDDLQIQNSETFLLSNMSPQRPELNRRGWRLLEEAIRELNARDDVLETYVLTAPVFYFNKKIDTIGNADEDFGVNIPVPHAFVKSVLVEKKSGKLDLWTFLMKNERQDGDLGDYLVRTDYAERLVGGEFWNRIQAKDLESKKSQPGTMW